jgi:hypothetical protein
MQLNFVHSRTVMNSAVTNKGQAKSTLLSHKICNRSLYYMGFNGLGGDLSTTINLIISI